MKKFIMMTLLVVPLAAPSLNAASTDYTYSTHNNTSWCDKTQLSYASFKGGRIYSGCNKTAINETVTHYQKDTSADYKAKSMKNNTWYYGPTKDNNAWSKEEVTLAGKNGSGIRLYS